MPVNDPKKQIRKKLSKENYTFNQVFNIFKDVKIPTKEEMKLEKTKNIKAKGKFARQYSLNIINAFNYAEELHDVIYKNLTTSDFQSILNKACKHGYSYSFQSCLMALFKHMDKYALQEDIIKSSYAQYVTIPITKVKKNQKQVFTSTEINAWENLKTNSPLEELTKNIIIFSLYTGCRISEIIYLKSINVFLDKGYMITGIKTASGINREIPIHPKLTNIILANYNPSHEFLFMYRNKAVDYSTFRKKAKELMNLNPNLGKHTIHECRHTFRTELEKLNIKHVIINSILGHKNNDVGLDVYTHVTLEEKITAVNMIDYSQKNITIFKNH